MEALQRSARRFRVEGAGRHVVGGKIIEQGARDRGLADPALVRAHHNHCRLYHCCPLTRPPIAGCNRPDPKSMSQDVPSLLLGANMAETRENSNLWHPVAAIPGVLPKRCEACCRSR